jgi:nucleotidyltransferase AbiEii toxin of type IV toxin-antitoxin system
MPAATPPVAQAVAGGTAIAFRYGEYRESLDLDFPVSDRDGYRALRQRIKALAR